jgi:hypothetical protein
MTATVLSFPTPWDRDAAEFYRVGTSNLVRAQAEAARLWDDAPMPAGRSGFAERLTAFARAVAYLDSYRPDDVSDLVRMNDGCLIEMRAVPTLLAVRAGL